MKTCSRCNNAKTLQQFAKKTAAKSGLQPMCKSCQHEYMTSYYKNSPGFADRAKQRSRDVRMLNKAFIEQYLRAHPCVDCGESNPVLLQFDHVRHAKRANVSHLTHFGASIATLRKEIDKCEVRCGNCHQRTTILRRKQLSAGQGTIPIMTKLVASRGGCSSAG